MTVYSHALATPATSLEPVVLALAFPLDYFSDVERENLLLVNIV